NADIDVSDIVAISLASKIGSGPDQPTQSPGQSTTPPVTISVPAGFAKTVILLKKDTAVGQYVFLRGGTSHAHGGVMS
ncbi:hypothetical protein OESDEN_18464, partial [Oesophagostomum dentatum]